MIWRKRILKRFTYLGSIKLLQITLHVCSSDVFSGDKFINDMICVTANDE